MTGREAALSCLKLLAALFACIASAGVPAQYAVGEESDQAAEEPAPEETGARATRPTLPPEPGLEAQTILKRAVDRYPDLQTGKVAEMLKGPLLLSYTREILGTHPMVMNHLLYSWPPDRARLDLRVVEGAGKDSISLLTDKAGWLLVDGQRVEVNRRELQTRMVGYSLQSLLKVQLELPELVGKNFGAERAIYEGRERAEGGQLLHLIGLQGSESFPRVVRLAIEADTYLLRRVEYATATGSSDLTFDDFRIALPSLKLPYRIVLARNGRAEDIVKIRQIEVLGLPAPSLLEPTDVRPPAHRGLYNVVTPQN